MKLKERLIYLTLSALIVATGLGDSDIAFATSIVDGDDIFPSVGEITITLFDDLGGLQPGFVGFTETIALDSGGTVATVHRDTQVGDTIDTEIVSLDLFGTSVNVGPTHIRAGTGNGVAMASTGQITNVVQNPLDPGFATGNPSSFASGDSFFDVFFEIDVQNFGITLSNQNPVTVAANNIGRLPPIGELYEHTGGGIIIGFQTNDVGQVEAVIHKPTPEPSTWLLFVVGIGGILGLGFKRSKKA